MLGLFLPSSSSSSDLTLVSRFRTKFKKTTVARIDIVGMILLLASSVLLVFAFEEAGTRYSWNSPVIISTIVIAGVAGITSFVWETFVDKATSLQEPVFPPSLLKDRLLSAMLA